MVFIVFLLACTVCRADKATRNLDSNWMRGGVCACHVETMSVIFLTRHTFRRYHYLWYTPEVAQHLCRRKRCSRTTKTHAGLAAERPYYAYGARSCGLIHGIVRVRYDISRPRCALTAERIVRFVLAYMDRWTSINKRV